MAGVTGPCPNCRSTITAPTAAAPAADPPSPATSPAPVPTLPEPAPATPEPAPVVVQEKDDEAEELAVPAGPRIRPEPRKRPERPQIIPVPKRKPTQDESWESSTNSRRESGRRAYRLRDALVPATFLTLAVLIVGSLLYFYAPGSPGQRLLEASRPPVVKPRPPDAQAPRSGLAENAAIATAPDVGPPPEMEAGPAEAGGKSPAVVANEVLDAFLSATDAASRVNLVEPATSEQELAATLLKGALPEVAQIFSDLPRQHPEEQMTDFPYRVSFFQENAPNVDFAILVRQRGSQPPRVFLPAFLDLVGGRLAGFTARPNTLPPARFHVFLEPIDGCYEMEVPGADRKFTFKLLASPFGKETARAYAANVSRLRGRVEDPDYPIRWGMRRRATVSVQWNHREDPERPFLELLDINSPDWNP